MLVAPSALLISGFHGNTDSVMVFFALLAILCVQHPSGLILSGVALGMSINIKVVSIILMPVLWLWIPGLGRKLVFSASAAFTVLLASMPFIFEDPVAIADKVLGYGGLYGQWGVSRAMMSLGESAHPLNLFLAQYLRFALLAAILLLSIWMQRTLPASSLFQRCGLLMIFFLALSPAFAVQYLVWIAPWIAILRPSVGILHLASSGVFLFGVYTFWSGRLPWNYADSLTKGPWRGWIVGAEVACWLSVALACVSLLIELKRSRARMPHSDTGLVRPVS